MNDHREAFELLAERGRPVGATALLERLEHEPAPLSDPAPPVRPRRGLLTMAAVFALVLAVGAGLMLALRRPDTDPAQPPVIELRESRHDQGGPQGPIVAGPGGFLRPVGEGFELSVDGTDWEPVVVPRAVDDPRPIITASSLTVWASNETWIIEGVRRGRDRVWVSSDGRSWTPVEWDEPLRSNIDLLIPSGPGFMARTVTEETVQFWWTVDAIEWTPVQFAEQFDTDRFWSPYGSQAGVTFAGTGDDFIARLAHTSDGVSWIESALDFGADVGDAMLPIQIYRLEGNWLVIGQQRLGGEIVVHTWTSDDFMEWTYRGTPSFTIDTEESVVQVAATDLAIVVTGSDDLRGFAVWVSSDGVTWDQVVEDLDLVQYITGRRLDDASYSVVYAR